MKKKLRSALIGFGGMGHFHASQYKNQPHCELVAICDQDAGQLGKADDEINLGHSGNVDLNGINTYLSYEDLVKNETFDILDICLPTCLHEPYAIRAMQDGYHVLCEKPMARNSASARKMIAASRQYQKYLMIAQCVRFMAPYRYIADSYRQNKYGKLLRLSMQRCGALPDKAWYHSSTESGGALLDLHLHNTDYVNSLLGKPDAVFTCGVERDTGGIDDLITNYIYNDGPCVSAESSWCRGKWQCSTIAVFEKATVSIEGDVVWISRPGQAESEKIDFKDQPNGYFSEISYFAACISQGKELELCSLQSTLDSIDIAMSEERSARTRRKVSIR